MSLKSGHMMHPELIDALKTNKLETIEATLIKLKNYPQYYGRDPEFDPDDRKVVKSIMKTHLFSKYKKPISFIAVARHEICGFNSYGCDLIRLAIEYGAYDFDYLTGSTPDCFAARIIGLLCEADTWTGIEKFLDACKNNILMAMHALRCTTNRYRLRSSNFYLYVPTQPVLELVYQLCDYLMRQDPQDLVISPEMMKDLDHCLICSIETNLEKVVMVYVKHNFCLKDIFIYSTKTKNIRFLKIIINAAQDPNQRNICEEDIISWCKEFCNDPLALKCNNMLDAICEAMPDLNWSIDSEGRYFVAVLTYFERTMAHSVANIKRWIDNLRQMIQDSQKPIESEIAAEMTRIEQQSQNLISIYGKSSL